MKRSTLLILLALNVMWAGSYSATKDLMQVAPFYLVTSMRYLAAALPLIVFSYFRSGLRMSANDFLRCSIMGVATFTLCPALMYKGVDLSRASDAAVLTSLEPLLASVGAYFYVRERISGRTAAAIGIAFLGALVLSEFWSRDGTINPVGTVLIFMAVCFEASYSVIGKEMLQRHSPLKIISVAIAVACLVNSAVLTYMGMWPAAANFQTGDWTLLIVYLALMCTVIGYTFWFVALKEDSVAKVAVTIFSQPVLGILIAWAWHSEIPTTFQVAGAAVILAGVAIAVTGRPDPARVKKDAAESTLPAP